MSVKQIEAAELRQYEDKQGLILQGCGGDLKEWIDGINNTFKDKGILLDGTAFQAENCCVFTHNGQTNLLYPFTNDVKIDLGKLAVWRLQTSAVYGGTWLHDYVEHELGGFHPAEQPREKPDCPLIGADGNIFNLMGIAARTLRRNGMADEAREMTDRIYASGSYDKALCIIGDYVNITSVDDDEGEDMDDCQDYDEDEGLFMN